MHLLLTSSVSCITGRPLLNRRRIRRQNPMQETAFCAHEHLRRVRQPIGLEECKHLRVQQCVPSIETVMTAVLTRELDTGQHDFGFFFHFFLRLCGFACPPREIL